MIIRKKLPGALGGPSGSANHRLWHKVTALVPLVTLSGAWTVSLAEPSATAATDVRSLPDGVVVPTEPLAGSASLGTPGRIGLAAPSGKVQSSATSLANGIPAAALAAYQRATSVIDSVDGACNLEWPLLAAIGRVESDHGRYGGSLLSAEGVSTPGIYGLRLDGSHGTARIEDTDAGLQDRDVKFDRAVGPMQFLPSTWSVVGVDGDGDKLRNPQDIDDAALAAAVYLCSGEEDLSSTADFSAAVFRYNHSRAYVELVGRTAAAYAEDGYSTVPTNAYAPALFSMPARETAAAKRPSGDRSVKDPVADVGGGKSPAAPADALVSEPGPTPPSNEGTQERPALPQAVGGLVSTLESTTTELLAGVDEVLGLLAPKG